MALLCVWTSSPAQTISPPGSRAGIWGSETSVSSRCGSAGFVGQQSGNGVLGAHLVIGAVCEYELFLVLCHLSLVATASMKRGNAGFVLNVVQECEKALWELKGQLCTIVCTCLCS